MANKANKYWMIHNPNNGHPRYVHSSIEDAKEEAVRLAKKHPGQRFFVLEAVGCYATKEPKAVKIRLKKPDVFQAIPF